jgi:hypothetical protein
MTEEQAFTIMRVQILAMGFNPQTKNQVTDGYLFAWQESVYPYFDQAVTWHKPFADQFDIGAKPLQELWRYLDAKWRGKEPVTFYDLEDKYEVKGYPEFWSRERLINACRYMYLRDVFNADFWEGFLALGRYPSEASEIATPMNRKEDLILGLQSNPSARGVLRPGASYAGGWALRAGSR